MGPGGAGSAFDSCVPVVLVLFWPRDIRDSQIRSPWSEKKKFPRTKSQMRITIFRNVTLTASLSGKPALKGPCGSTHWCWALSKS